MPRASARFRWTSAASRCSAGIASSSSPSRRATVTVRRSGLMRHARRSRGRPGWAGTAAAAPRRSRPHCSMPSSYSVDLDRAGLAGGPEVRLERDRVERDEPVDQPADLAGGAQQPDVGTAVGDDGEVGEVGAQDRPHQRHRLAPRAPAADPDGHPGSRSSPTTSSSVIRLSAICSSRHGSKVHKRVASAWLVTLAAIARPSSSSPRSASARVSARVACQANACSLVELAPGRSTRGRRHTRPPLDRLEAIDRSASSRPATPLRSTAATSRPWPASSSTT